MLGFDLEMHNISKYAQVTCLIQLATDGGREFVIDTLADGVWKHVSLLQSLFADPSIVKIGHSIGGLDVRSLQRDFGIFVLNAFDTYEAARVLRLEHVGLARVCQHYGLKDSEEYIDLKSRYQACDWRRRPLTEPMIRYGRYDVHYLIKLRELMMRDLIENKESRLGGYAAAKELEEGTTVATQLSETLKAIEAAEGDVVPLDSSETSGTIPIPSNELDDDLMTDDGNEPGPPVATAVTEEEDLGYFTPGGDDSDAQGYCTPTADADLKTAAAVTNTRDVPSSVVTVNELRLQPNLMSTLSRSQQRCLDLWKVKPEELKRNEQFISIVKRAQDGFGTWTVSNMKLLEELMAWRDTVSTKEQTLPPLVCSLDFLVSVAHKRPPSEAALRRLRYYLPQLLEDLTAVYLQELLSLVRESLASDGITIEETIHSFPNIRTRRGILDIGGQNDKESEDSSPKNEPVDYTIAAAAATVVVVAVAVIGVVLLRSRRR